MKVDPVLLRRSLEEAATAQLSMQLQSEGYDVQLDEQMGAARADITARRPDGTLIVYEIKAPGKRGVLDWAREAAVLQKEARARGGRFKLVFVRSPRETRTEIAGLDEAMKQALIDHPPEVFSTMAAETVVNAVSQIAVEELSLHDEVADIAGDAIVDVTLYSADDEAFAEESLPFSFVGQLDRSNQIISFQVAFPSLSSDPQAS